jgi:hypothetical protein
MQVTLCARAKILQLLQEGKAFRIQGTEGDQGAHVDLLPNVEVTGLDVTICSIPLVIADVQTLTLLAGQEVDFKYSTSEFIISKRGKKDGNIQHLP